MVAEKNNFNLDETNNFLAELEKLIEDRLANEVENSYITSLKQRGLNRITQKLGEETVETIVEALNGTSKGFVQEAADLLFHYLILLSYKGHNLGEIIQVLETRHQLNVRK